MRRSRPLAEAVRPRAQETKQQRGIEGLKDRVILNFRDHFAERQILTALAREASGFPAEIAMDAWKITRYGGYCSSDSHSFFGLMKRAAELAAEARAPA
ncbi:hypothetical protein MY3296_004127 [Beauveria thailandica]